MECQLFFFKQFEYGVCESFLVGLYASNDEISYGMQKKFFFHYYLPLDFNYIICMIYNNIDIVNIRCSSKLVT